MVTYTEETLNHFENKGVIYILINPSFKEAIVKIGKTSRQSEKRAKELSYVTGVPTPFTVLLDRVVLDMDLAEKLIHKKLDSQRINPKREFFQLPLNDAVRTVYEICMDVDEQLLDVSQSVLAVFFEGEYGAGSFAKDLKAILQNHIGGNVDISVICTSQDGKARCEMSLGDNWKVRNSPLLFHDVSKLEGVADLMFITDQKHKKEKPANSDFDDFLEF